MMPADRTIQIEACAWNSSKNTVADTPTRYILEQLQRKFLVKPVSFEGIQSIETLEYPIDALRELLLNALVHRHYTGSMTQIRVHDDDHLCIWNSGNLPEELSIAELTQVHASFPRNPLIAQVCYKAGYIDNWGRGIDKVMQACKSQHLPTPHFEHPTGGLLVTLYKQESSSLPEHTTGKTTGKNQQAVLDLITEDPSTTIPQMAKALSLTEDGVRYHLKSLQKAQRLKRVGGKKGGYWQILDPEE